MDGAGCLVILGMVLLIPVFLFTAAVIVKFVSSQVATIQDGGWAALPGLFRGWMQALWQWLVGGSSSGTFSPVLLLFLTVYLFLFWQWIAFLRDWRPRLRSPLLWAISSAYFVTAIVGFAISTWPGEKRGGPAGVPSDDLGAWLATTFMFSAVAGAFLCATLSLWVIGSRVRSKRTKVPSSKPEDFASDGRG